MNNLIKSILESFEKKFTKKQDILNCSPENPLIFGEEPPVAQVKQFLHESLESAYKQGQIDGPTCIRCGIQKCQVRDGYGGGCEVHGEYFRNHKYN